MCLNYINIRKTHNPYNVSSVFVSCGQCEECRKAMKNEWTTRLKAEIEEYHTKQNYNVGFLTLTYQDKCLPHIPKSFFKEGEYEKIPCFSYKDIKKFTDTIRNHLFKKYNMTNGFRYFITSEYGENTHRPHYHGIILFDSRINHTTMWQICHDAWSGTTDQIKNNSKRQTKRQFLGQIASLDSFIPRDNYACGAYVVKYVCKDIEFQDTIKGKFDHLNKKTRNNLRHFMPFHKQSLGFGACLIKDKTDEELVELYNNGVQFTGNNKMVELPVYLKNKILFTTQKLYNLNTHKFETIKKYTKFFYDNKELIYNKKFNSAKVLLSQYFKKEYWQIHKNQLDDDFKDKCYTYCQNIANNVDLDELTRFYVLWYGVKYENCRYSENNADILFARYNPAADLTMLQSLDYNYWSYLTDILSFMFSLVHLNTSVMRTKDEQLYAQIKAYFEKML